MLCCAEPAALKSFILQKGVRSELDAVSTGGKHKVFECVHVVICGGQQAHCIHPVYRVAFQGMPQQMRQTHFPLTETQPAH
jgi:hypothetical protein